MKKLMMLLGAFAAGVAMADAYTTRMDWSERDAQPASGAGGGGGATSNYTGAADLPWAEVSDEITSVELPDVVTVIGVNLWAGLGKDVVINGETIIRRKEIVAGAPAEDPVGAISPAEFERVEIVDGKAYLGVAVYTNSEVKVLGEGGGGGWGVATNGVIEGPAPGKQGFLYLMSKGK